MSLDDSLNETERAKLAVWDYPVSDKYTKIWWTMQETGLPKTFEEGIEKVLASKGPQDGFAFIGKRQNIHRQNIEKLKNYICHSNSDCVVNIINNRL